VPVAPKLRLHENRQKSVLIWYTPEEMFALVTAVEQYPEFLPWCDRPRAGAGQRAGMTAEVGIALRYSADFRHPQHP
jgi:ribosome-associated toxin RatA of RatAB toxin-antitoxin module